jgi:hypothetical protein
MDVHQAIVAAQGAMRGQSTNAALCLLHLHRAIDDCADIFWPKEETEALIYVRERETTECVCTVKAQAKAMGPQKLPRAVRCMTLPLI